MRLRQRGYLVESEYKIGFSWNTVRGKREITGKRPDGRFLVTQPGKPVNSTLQEILSASDIDFEIKRDTQSLKAASEREVNQRREQDRIKEREFTHGFADKFPAHQKRRVINALLHLLRFNGKIMSRKDYIHDAVSKGAVVVGSGSERKLQKLDGAYLLQKDLSKTAMDYADYLIRNRKL